jgi:Flp pilus assembly pilin Flp
MQQQHLHAEDVTQGQGLVEYALIILLVALTVVALIAVMGGSVDLMYTNITTSLTGAGM